MWAICHNPMKFNRNSFKRRIPVSSCITQSDAEEIEEACLHYSISISEMIARLVAKAVHDRFPTDRVSFDQLYPLHHNND